MAEETEETAAEPRSQMWKHEAMVEWLQSEKGLPEDADAPTVVAYAFAHRVEWRRTDIYRNLVENRTSEVMAERETKAAERKAQAEAKAQERAEAKAKADAEKAAAAKAEPQKATKATKEAAPVKATKKTSSKGKATEDNPFE